MYRNLCKLNNSEFDSNDDFSSKYNRFFRLAVLYSLKSYFPKTRILIKNVFHEQGLQENNYYFPWHLIYKIGEDPLITVENKKIVFLPKDHKKDERANIIHLCDSVLGASVNILHGVDRGSRSQNKEELIDLYFPLFKRMILEPENKNSSYKYFNRISIEFFPYEKTDIGSIDRYKNHFYKKDLFFMN